MATAQGSQFSTPSTQDAQFPVIERYRDVYTYFANSSLQQLTFDVKLNTQTNVGHSEPKLLCSRRIRWGEKILSPAEGAAVINEELQVRQLALASSGAPRTLMHEGAAEHKAFLHAVMAHEGVTLGQKFVSYCAGDGLIFTRPPRENFVDPQLFAAVTDPPMEPTPLDFLQMRREIAERGPPMNILLALGYAAEDPQTGNVSFTGLEAVMCSLHPAVGEGRYSARPSLGRVHTAHVDTRTIYTFCVDLGQSGELASPLLSPHTQSTVGSSADLQRLRTVAAAAADAAQDAGDDLGAKQKRALLRQAVGTSGSAKHDLSNPFTLPPLHKQLRLHIFGVVETATGIHADTLFARCTWMLPDNWKPDAAVNDEMATPHHNEFMSQLAYSSLLRNDKGELAPYHIFNLPFNAHLIGKRSGGAVRLVLELHSLGTTGDAFQTPVGYGHVTVPLNPGNYCFDSVLLWAPKPTGRETLKSVFVGGAPSLSRLWDVVIQSRGVGKDMMPATDVSKAGLQALSVGKMSVRMMVALQANHDTPLE